MSNIYPLLPKLTLNRRFVQDFLDAPELSCAVGVIAERKQVLPLLALRPGIALPGHVTERGFEFGHSVLGDSDYEIVQFTFDFRGFASYHVLLNPSDPVVCEVLQRMVELGSYFILAIAPDEHVTAFRADIGAPKLTGLIDHLPRILRSATSGAQYDKVLAKFYQRPEPPGHVLEWVCRGDLSYLDLVKDRMELSPASTPELSADTPIQSVEHEDPPQDDINHPIAMLPMIAEITAGELQAASDLQQSLREARSRPHILGDAEVNRATRLCNSQMAMVPTYREQLSRWRQASPSRSQREALSRLSKDIDQIEMTVAETLALLKEMAPGTIDAVLRMDDGELGMAVFEGRIKPPKGEPLSEELRRREQRTIAVMLDAVGGNIPAHANLLEFLAVSAPQMPLFERLMAICNEEDINSLCGEYPGLYRFAKTMEEIATGIRSGTISVPY